jgi:hypothetical protein
MTTIKDVLAYRGNKNYFCCFCQDEDDKYFVLFAQTDGIYIEGEQEDFGFEFKKYINPIKHKITLPVSKRYYIIPVNDCKDFELINKILEVVWMQDD